MGNANFKREIKAKLQKYFPICFKFIIASLTAADYKNLLSAGDNEENFRNIIYQKIINTLLNQWFASNEESPQTTVAIQQSNNSWIPIGRSGATGGSVAPHFIKSNTGLISRFRNLVWGPKPNYGIAVAPLLVISQLTYHGYRWNIQKISGKRLMKKSIDCIGIAATGSLVATGMAAMSITMPPLALFGGGLLGGVCGQFGMDALTRVAFDLKLDEKVEKAFLRMNITLESSDQEIIDSFINMAEENNFEKLIESLLIVCAAREKKTN